MGEIPANCRFTREHEWAQESGAQLVIGITDYAQHALGDVVFVELPAVGTLVKKGKSFGTVESVKAASDIYAPVDGKVVAINEALSERPELVNSSPYKDGWMIKIEASSKAQLAELLDAKAYGSYIAELG